MDSSQSRCYTRPGCALIWTDTRVWVEDGVHTQLAVPDRMQHCNVSGARLACSENATYNASNAACTATSAIMGRAQNVFSLWLCRLTAMQAHACTNKRSQGHMTDKK